MTLTFRLSTKHDHGTAELLLRAYEGTAAFRAKSRLHVPFDLWNEQAQRLILPPRVTRRLDEVTEHNQRIDALMKHILDQWELDRYVPYNSQWLQQTIDTFAQVGTVTTKTITLTDAVRDYAQQRIAQDSTYKNIITLANALDKYGHSVPIACVTADYVTAFADYLYSYLSPNTAKKMLSTLRSVCNDAVSNERLARSPFGRNGYVIGAPIYGTPHYLTADELKDLREAVLPDKLAVQRDIFVFQCQVGCRVSDLIKLTTANIVDGDFLEYVPVKTSNISATTVRVPLSKCARELIDKYRHTRLVRGRCQGTQCEFAEYVTDPTYDAVELMPFISPQKYNKAIHDFFALANMNRTIIDIDKHTGKPVTTTLMEIATSHLARKTFSQMVYSKAGSERIAASLTGHSPNSRAFARYNEVDDTMKRAIIDRL